jgi:hypothetical protein
MNECLVVNSGNAGLSGRFWVLAAGKLSMGVDVKADISMQGSDTPHPADKLGWRAGVKTDWL